MEDMLIAVPLSPTEARAVCQKLFDAYVAEHGTEPRYNTFVRMVVEHGVSRTMARRMIEQLRTIPITEEKPVMSTVAQTSDPTASSLPRDVGRLTALVASQDRAIQLLEETVASLASRLDTMEAATGFVTTLLEMLQSDEECWRVAESLLNTGSISTHGRLHEWIAAQVGKPRPLKYIR
jgi:hypothetical protein